MRIAAAVVLSGAAALWWWRSSSGPPAAERDRASIPAPAAGPPRDPEPSAPGAAVAVPTFTGLEAPPPAPNAAAPGLSPDDVAFLQRISTSLAHPMFRPADSDVTRIENLERTTGLREIRQLLVLSQLRVAEFLARERRFEEARSRVVTAQTLDPNFAPAFGVGAFVCAEAQDWACSERDARQAERLGSRDQGVAYNLAFALYRLDRGPESLDVLKRPEQQSHRPSVELKAQIEGEQASDADKTAFASDRFTLRFDGEEHQGVARDALRILDKYYLLLAETYDHRPQSKIPVILYSRQDYYTATGAPAWSGGQFSNHSGRIAMPVRGMPQNLDAQGESTLIHELSHAFVADMTGGVIADARELNEGLAQYMEGDRIETVRSADQLRRIAANPTASVSDFYFMSLVFAQHLLQTRGQSGVNELLLAMRETGSADAAFQKVFGEPAQKVRARALEAFWRRYS